jgi:hypothetical protein
MSLVRLYTDGVSFNIRKVQRTKISYCKTFGLSIGLLVSENFRKNRKFLKRLSKY